MDTYCVLFEGKETGGVTVSREGLYYSFSCKAGLRAGEMYRLFLTTEKETIDLGILVPQGNMFVLRKKLPIKKVRGNHFSFGILNAEEKRNTNYIPVAKDQPFPYIEKLLHGKLEMNMGNVVIVLPEN